MKTRKELEAMSSLEIAQHIEAITQTDICKNEKYCKMVCRIFLSKTK